jgi:hypothetical protein
MAFFIKNDAVYQMNIYFGAYDEEAAIEVRHIVTTKYGAPVKVDNSSNPNLSGSSYVWLASNAGLPPKLKALDLVKEIVMHKGQQAYLLALVCVAKNAQ